MKNTPLQAPQLQLLNAFQSAMASANEITGELSKTVAEIIKIQSEAGTAGFVEALPTLIPTPPTSIEGAEKSLWQVPTLYKTQAQRMLKTMMASFAALSLGQHQMLKWSYQSLNDRVQDVSEALTQVNEVVVDRRISADVISFEERRSALVHKAAELAQKYSTEETKTTPRVSRQAAA